MARETVDHYEVLGVSPKASSDEVKRAYRSLSRLYHPDKAGLLSDDEKKRENERRMIALNAAYQILMSPRQRCTYDLSRDAPTVQPQQNNYSSAYSAAATAAARRAASWGGHSRSFTPRQANPPMPTGSGMGVNGRNSPDETAGVKPSGAPSFLHGNVPRPRYYTAGKYTQSSRQARRMDPSQYTTHVDGRAHEFDAPAGMTGTSGKAPSTSVGSESDSYSLGAPRQPTWLQKQMDLASEWEEKHCPAEPVEKYKWRKASDNWLRNIRDRKSAREQLEEESEKLYSFDVAGQMSGCVA
jgi:curved DNA-binding protein CbpA